MTVECPKCKKKYNVNEALIPAGGATIRCPSCLNVFTLYKEPLDIPLEPIIEETVSTTEEEIIVEKEPFVSQEEEPAVTVTSENSGIETKIPPIEERTKLWEKLQQSYKPEKKEEPISPAMEEEPIVTEEPAIPTQTETPVVAPKEEIQSVETPSVEPFTEEILTEQEPKEVTTEKITQDTMVEEEIITEEDKIEKEAKRLARSLVKDILLYHGDKVEIGLRQGNLAQLIGDEIRRSWKFYKDNFPLEKTGGVNYFKNALNEIIGKGKPIFK